VSAPVAIRRQRASGSTRRAGVALLLAAALAACAPQPEPRTVLDFMDDGIAREGVLTRCNQYRDETSTDAECANARRAAAALALEAERARAPVLERASEDKLVALRETQARAATASQSAAAAARAAAEAAYEARWRDPSGPRTIAGTQDSAAPTFGAPVGAVLPSMTESTLFEVYAESTEPLGRRSLEVAAVEPPANDLLIAPPEIELADLGLVPRPFRDDARP
jgi:hypothetical protein